MALAIEKLKMQDLDKRQTEAKADPVFTEEVQVSRPFRKILSVFAPLSINLDSFSRRIARVGFDGSWCSPPQGTEKVAAAGPKFTVKAFGKPLADQDVSLWCVSSNGGDSNKKITTKKTDENGNVVFDIQNSNPISATYAAVIGEQLPKFAMGADLRTMVFNLTVWFVVTRSNLVFDMWARWQGRSYNEKLPLGFWGTPKYVTGLAGSNVGVFDLIPVVSESSVTTEYGVSAWCGTTNPAPSPQECCEIAKKTWWAITVYATNDPKKVLETKNGQNKIGSGNINLDYHVKFKFSDTTAAYLGRCLVQSPSRCSWEDGTEASCGG